MSTVKPTPGHEFFITPEGRAGCACTWRSPQRFGTVARAKEAWQAHKRAEAHVEAVAGKEET